jgi:pantetheine-phosphate adenylyltransferase
MYERGLVALSADPVHYGHLDLIQMAKSGCKHLLVLVANNDEKRNSYLFTKNERINFVRRLLHGMADVEVIESSTEILSDTYLNFGCDALFRGIRDEKDRVYEETQMKYHKMIYPKLNAIPLKFGGEKSNISSSLVKAFTKHYIDVSNYVPIFVKKALEERINNQYKIAITGGIAVGKSWVTNSLTKVCNDRGVRTTAVKFDDFIRMIYEESTPGSIKMRQELEYLCLEAGSQTSILNQDGTVNRPVLGRFIFSHPSNDVRIRVQELTQPLVDAKCREALNKAGSGLVIIEWAQLAEMDMGRLANHNVIVVDSPDRSFFIEQRKISQEEFKNKTQFQWTAEKKSQVLESAARKDGEGHIIQFSNTIQDNKINDLADEIISLFSLGD